MALNNNFYEEIFTKEKYWIELASRNLLNVYYLNGKDGLREFYSLRKKKLESEINLSQNQVLSNFLNIINDIIDEIDYMTDKYRRGETVDVGSITRLFITTQMNNTIDTKSQSEVSQLETLSIRKKVLEALRDSYIGAPRQDEYDDFYVEEDKQKVA